MKTHIGSIQRKGRKLHLVFTRDGKQVWRALHTESLVVARERAMQIAPRRTDDDAAWLRQLVRLGELARAELLRRKSLPELKWQSLWCKFEERARPAVPTASREPYRRWIELLASCANEIPTPTLLSQTDAERIAADLCASHLSAGRMLLFYRRVGRTLFNDETVWASVAHLRDGQIPKPHEFYRRLSVEEVRRVVGHLSSHGNGRNMERQALADMVAIGYYTGLRLSDVAELDQSEISQDGPFLHIQPNKVRHSKVRFLTIPLMGESGVPPHITDAITGHAGGGMHARYTQPSAAAMLRAVQHAIVPL